VLPEAPRAATTTDVRPEPANPLPDGALKMWRWEALISAVVLFAIALGVAMGVGALKPWLPLAAAAVGVTYAIVVPRERHRRWRWALHEQELDILYGIWEVTRTIVPITRIQHVSVQRTGWTDTFGLVRLHVHTAAGTTTIPGLAPAQADDVRDRILARLQTPDDL
jgi:membrane protein YdbS with pleckstrin-like domain